MEYQVKLEFLQEQIKRLKTLADYKSQLGRLPDSELKSNLEVLIDHELSDPWETNAELNSRIKEIKHNLALYSKKINRAFLYSQLEGEVYLFIDSFLSRYKQAKGGIPHRSSYDSQASPSGIWA